MTATQAPEPGSEPNIEKLGPGNYRSIARGAGLTPQHVSRVLRGLKGVSFLVAARIARTAGVTLDEMYEYVSTSPEFTAKSRRTMAEIDPKKTRRRKR